MADRAAGTGAVGLTADLPQGVALGLDVGERRIGVAKGDPTGFLASPLTTVLRGNDQAAVEAIAALAADHGAATLVVGVPLGAEGEVTQQAQRIQAFGRKLRSIRGARVVFWDERFTTQEAEESLSAVRPRRAGSRANRVGLGARGAPTARRREAERRRIDAAAAAVILQNFLDHQRSASTPPAAATSESPPTSLPER